ncbi:MAG TPA: tRNA (adenosine(37)-N6)-threonylcarbamoyltransferase complex dimerization subunit type 1 TsaB [Thermodesulfovibrionales bacterium]|nr:tRNA (adenosine(37)-N6)-threonylcarbamoyltransferase complex dimerization subunit type 1 TsaB [Thermodesulfovibrionales bacterium]
MRILAIETSTMLGGVAIMDDSDGLITEMRLNIRTTYSERLMTGISLALKQAGMRIGDIDVFGVSIGPGSFTGLRIGLSTIKGFSYATGKPVVSVPTLEAFVWNFPFSRFPVCIMLDARKKEVYAALFRWKDSGFERIMEERSIKPSELAETLKEPVIFAGEGAAIYRDNLVQAAGENALFPAPQMMAPSPSHVAYLGLRKAERHDFSDPVSLVPLYVRKSEAEMKIQPNS